MPMPGRDTPSGRSEQSPTLWRCHRCTAIITIYSADIIQWAVCPICRDVALDLRGSFETILGLNER